MNIQPLLLQILSSRLGGSSNPMVRELMAQMTADSGSGVSQSNADRFLTQLAQNGHPTVSLLAKQIMAQRTQSRLTPIQEADAEVVTESPHNLKESEHNNCLVEGEPESNHKTLEEAANAAARLTALQDKLDDLAQALGACASCWGEDAQCRICRGRGRAGFSMPDKQLFGEFVLPAVRMLKAQQGKNGQLARKPEAYDTGALR